MGATEAGVMVPFDVSKHIKFVPDFRENEVDKYFLHFEKVAKSLKWPEDNWALLPKGSQHLYWFRCPFTGVDLEVMSIPLHRIQVQSDLVSGPVSVGVRPSLPVKGVDFILGNDLAGDKVMPSPCMVSRCGSK